MLKGSSMRTHDQKQLQQHQPLIELEFEQLEERIAPDTSGSLGYEGHPGNQGNGLRGYEGHPGNQGGGNHHH
jgi:hypothetical protein